MVVARNQVLVDDIFLPRARQHRAESGQPRQKRPSRRVGRPAESLLAVAAGILLFALIGSSVYTGVSRVVRATVYYDTHSSTPSVAVTVKPGDSLWKFARMYGAPGDYTLDNVQAIASANHLNASASLLPGQVLNVPVRNPQLVARLGLGHHGQMARND